MRQYPVQPCPATAAGQQGTVYHVWPVQPSAGRITGTYTGTSLDDAGKVIEDIMDRRRLPAAIATMRGNGTVFMTLFQIPGGNG